MTMLKKFHDIINKGYIYSTYTRDSWTISEDGTEIWCTAWPRGQAIRPYGDGCHVIVGFTVYHCDELMEILQRLENDGHTWGIEGVEMTRVQQINGRWQKVNSVNKNALAGN